MIDFKEETYKSEEKLSPFAKRATNSAGRQRQEPPCPIRTDFQRDRDRIIHSKAFRRLKHKTQVFLSPEGDHYRTRLTHTLEVSQIARTIARCLKLNEDLTEAIALGHDLGHTPYGHAGERSLNNRTHFAHNEQSLRVVDYIENDFKGMNLTAEVRDGILNHTGNAKPFTLEGQAVALSDRIAYLNHDIDDALRGSIISQSDIPKSCIGLFGATHSARISAMIMDIINNSYGKNYVESSKEYAKEILNLRDFMFDRVYFSKKAKAEEGKAEQLIEYLYDYFYKNSHLMPQEFEKTEGTKEQHVCDYISTMSDLYATRLFESLTVPKGWDKL